MQNESPVDQVQPWLNETLTLLGRRLRHARLRRGLSMRLASIKLNVALSTYQRLEAGDAGISIALMLRALSLLGFSHQINALADPHLDLQRQAVDHGRVQLRGRPIPSTKGPLA